MRSSHSSEYSLKKERIVVGSLNQNKIAAVQSVFEEYFVRGARCNSDVAEQPLSIEAIMLGAKNRAKASYSACKYSVGIEDGIFPIPPFSIPKSPAKETETKRAQVTRYMNICCCVIYDGKNEYVGFSPAFEIPAEIGEKMAAGKGELTLSEAFSSIAGKPNIGQDEGVIGFLTNGKMNRKEYTELAVKMTKLQLDNAELYSGALK